MSLFAPKGSTIQGYTSVEIRLRARLGNLHSCLALSEAHDRCPDCITCPAERYVPKFRQDDIRRFINEAKSQLNELKDDSFSESDRLTRIKTVRKQLKKLLKSLPELVVA